MSITVGCHDNGYAPDLQALKTEDLGSKVVLLPGHAKMGDRIRALGFPSLPIDGLFQRDGSETDLMISPPASPPGLYTKAAPTLVTSVTRPLMGWTEVASPKKSERGVSVIERRLTAFGIKPSPRKLKPDVVCQGQAIMCRYADPFVNFPGALDECVPSFCFMNIFHLQFQMIQCRAICFIY